MEQLVEVGIGVKTKRNAFLHNVGEYLYQKVNNVRMYEIVFESVLESVLASIYTSAHGGIPRVIVYVFHNLLRKPAPERPMCLLWPCPAYV